MLISKLHPFVRHARVLNLTSSSVFEKVVPLDNRLFYACKGFGIISVNDTEYEMYDGDLLIISAGNPYHIFSPSGNTSYIAINFDYTQQATEQSEPIIPVAPTNFQENMLIEKTDVFKGVLYRKEINSIYKRLLSIVNEHSNKLLHYKQKTSCTLTDCLIDCVRNIGNDSSASANKTIEKLLVYLQKNYNTPIDNCSIGEHFGYHPNYISFLIKKFTGMSLHQYLLHLRLSNAMSLLENTSLSIEEIAFYCGFYNSAHFSNCFKKNFNIPPSKFRNV